MPATLRAAILTVLLGVVVGACVATPTVSDEVLGTALEDEDVMLFLPRQAPATFRLFNVSRLMSDTDGIDGAISFFGREGTVVAVCAGRNPTWVTQECPSGDPGTEVVRSGVRVTVAVACVSDICDGFNRQLWLENFGNGAPTVLEIKRMAAQRSR